MDRPLKIAYAVARGGAWLGGTLILASAIMVAVDIMIRNLFAVTLGGAAELSGYALAVGSAWALALALLQRAHVRIDLLYQRLPIRLAALLDIFGLLAFTVFMILLTRHGYGVFLQSFGAGSQSVSALAIPLAIPQALWILGLALFVVVALLLLVRAVLALMTGHVSMVVRLLGSRSTMEEVEQEISHADHGHGHAE